MKALPNGYFSFGYSSEDLSKGLRTSQYSPRNTKFLTKCEGAVGEDKVLKTLNQFSSTLNAANGDIVFDDFPFPQLFVLERHVVLCNRQSILEWDGSEFVLKITGLTGGSKWNVASAYNFIYFSNEVEVVIRDPMTQAYSLDTDKPINSAACNFNGQIIVGVV